MATITGTELDDPNLQGTAADDTISGLGGRDHLNGGAGNDTLLGGTGDDAMHGDAGADTMFGGAGNDDYYVDDVNDVVSETTVAGVDDGGTDRVYSTASYSLSPFLERLVLLESAGAISATGNAQVNSIVGNSNANIISGGGAKDTLTGGAGADTFVLGPANAANTVTITDFAVEDRFGITASDYGLTQGSGLVDNGSGTLVLDPTWFATVTGTQGTAAGHGQFLYNTTTRSMMWDADGSGPVAGTALATLQTGAVVTAANFAISGATSNPGVGNVSINDVNITEGNSGTQVATFSVTRSGGTAAFNVNYATADGTATAGSDYVAQPTSTLSFAAGDLTKTISVTINGDTTVEPNETFSVNLSGATNGGTITKSQGTGTIVNDDAAAGVGNISISDVNITEGNSGTQVANFTVTRSGGTAAFNVNYATADGTATAGSDYVAQPTSTLSFAAGDLTKTISVTVNGDTTVEPNETFSVNLSGATNGGTITKSQGTGTIVNDDAAAGVGNISISDVNITEGNSGTQVATFSVTRSGGTAAFNVNYATADGTATASSDYVAQPTSTLSFAAGDLTKTISVTVNGDTTVEPNETFSVNLSGATNGGTITKSQGTGTIVNDDTAGGVGNISIDDVTITEGNSGTKVATFTVSHTGSAAFSVDYATANSTATAGTTGTADYVATSGTLNFANGTSTQTVSVTIRGDTTYEPNETFFVNLTGATNGGTILDGQGLGTIANDDTAPVGPHVVAAHDMAALGSTDPSGIAYVPGQGLFTSDSEVEESPFLRSTNLWKLQPDGTLIQSFSLLNFTKEPTGLTFDPSTGHLYISDDDKFKLYWVDPSNPTAKLGEFDLKPLACNDPEDVAVNPNNGHLFICNGDQVAGPTSRSIVEINNTGTQVFSTTVLPTEIKDPEALCYDASHDVFFVGGGFSPDIWVVDRSGSILQKLDVLEGYRNPVGPTSAHVKDLELAPSSDPNDDPGTLNLYVADYGNSHVSDGRVLEIADPFSWSSPASVVSTSNLTTVQSPAQPGAAPNITPQSTSGTNVILATNSQDVLTGTAAQDQFVFAPTPSGPSVQHTITDFEVGIDKIDVSQFSNISASALPTETQQGSDTLVTLDGHDTLLLKNVAAVNLHGSDFIVHA